MLVAKGQPDPPERLLLNRSFVLLWCAYAISAFGDHLSELAVLKAHDALRPDVDITPINARMTFMFFLAFFLLSPIAGILADRFPRTALMIGADLVRAVILMFFGSLILWFGLLGSWGPLMPFMFVGMFAAIFSPARAALLPTIIRPQQLVRANGLISGLGIISTMGAAVVGGYLAQHYAPEVAFRVNAVTFAASALCLAGIRPPASHRAASQKVGFETVLSDLAGGVRYVRTHRRVRELIAIAALVWFCGALVNSVIPAIVRDVYHGDYQGISSYRAYLGAGFVVGAGLVSLLGRALRSEIAMTWGLFGVGLSMGLFSVSAFLPLAPTSLSWIGAAGVFGGGVFGVAVMASFNALLQRTVADRFLGRVMGVRDLATVGALLLACGALGLPQWTRVDRWVGYILAGVALLTLGAGAVTLAVRLSRGILSPSLTFAQHANEFVAKAWWRLERIGRCTVPRTGPVIIAANHTCAADPLFICAAAPFRPIAFLVAAEFSNWPVVRWFLRLVECIPVTRSGQDTTAFRRACRHLQSGKAMGVFIEGRIVPPGERLEPKDGVVLLALKSGAKVVPVHISGTKYYGGVLRELFARHRARIRFGPLLDVRALIDDPRDRESVRAASRFLYDVIYRLASDEGRKSAATGPSLEPVSTQTAEKQT